MTEQILDRVNPDRVVRMTGGRQVLPTRSRNQDRVRRASPQRSRRYGATVGKVHKHETEFLVCASLLAEEGSHRRVARPARRPGREEAHGPRSNALVTIRWWQRQRPAALEGSVRQIIPPLKIASAALGHPARQEFRSGKGGHSAIPGILAVGCLAKAG